MTEHILASDLRNAVLQAAFSGTLTNQNNNDYSAIETANNAHIIEDTKELPFELPENWAWVKFGNISTYANSKKKINAKNADPNIWMLEMEDIEKGGNLLVKKKVCDRKAIGDKTLFTKGNILYSKLRPYLLKILIADENGICTPELVPFDMLYNINTKYTTYYLKSPYVDYEINKVTYGVKMPRVGTDTMKNLFFPFPPIEEQQRIVDKVDELMAKIDEYEKLENQLVELKKDFPTNMKDSILQAAMQGKLTKRFKSDTTVEIDNEFDSIDIEIPSEWKIAKYHSVCEINTGLTFNKSNQCQKSNSALRILRGGNINDNFEYVLKDDDVYVTYTDKYIRLKIGDIISPAVTSMEKMCKVGYIDKELENTTAGGFVYIYSVKDTNVLNPRFLMYFICSKFNKDMCIPNIHKSGQAFYNLKKTGLIQQPIVIPPIEEQQRIVELLDRVLLLCDQLQEVI